MYSTKDELTVVIPSAAVMTGMSMCKDNRYYIICTDCCVPDGRLSFDYEDLVWCCAGCRRELGHQPKNPYETASGYPIYHVAKNVSAFAEWIEDWTGLRGVEVRVS